MTNFSQCLLLWSAETGLFVSLHSASAPSIVSIPRNKILLCQESFTFLSLLPASFYVLSHLLDCEPVECRHCHSFYWLCPQWLSQCLTQSRHLNVYWIGCKQHMSLHFYFLSGHLIGIQANIHSLVERPLNWEL